MSEVESVEQDPKDAAIEKQKEKIEGLQQDNEHLRQRIRLLEEGQEPRGLWEKYRIIRKPRGEVVTNGFVLRPETDPHALTALLAYAEACNGDNPELASDLLAWAERIQDASST